MLIRRSAGGSPAQRRRARGTIIFALFFAVIWTMVVSIFDALLIHDAYRAVAATGYPTTPATIVSSDTQLRLGRGKGRGRTYRVQVAYTYSVNGTEFDGRRVAYGRVSISSRALARAAARRYPPGSRAVAHYNPHDPSDAVLETGIDSPSRFAALIAAPFNIMLIGLWVHTALALAGRTGGRPLVLDGPVTRVRLAPARPVYVGLGAAMAAAIGSLLVFGLVLGTRVTPVGLAAAAGAIIGAGMLGHLWMTLRARSGRYDLLIDPVRRLLILPGSAAGKGDDREIAFDRIREITADRSTTRAVNNRPAREVWLVLDGRDETEQRVRLGSWADGSVATEFAKWLRARLSAHLSSSVSSASGKS